MTGDKLQGVMRLDKPPHQLEIGEYTKYENIWYGRCPNGDLCNLAHHRVNNRKDHIDVQPSILVRGSDSTWHGYLTDGVWIDAD